MPDKLRNFLTRHPQPASVRVRIGDDTDVVTVGVGRSKWRDVESAIPDDADAIDALDSRGSVLRTLRLAADRRPMRDDEASPNIVALARLISEAHEAGARRVGEPYQVAFQQQTQLLQVFAERLLSLERAYHKLITAPPDSGDEQLANLAQVVLQNQLNGGKQ